MHHSLNIGLKVKLKSFLRNACVTNGAGKLDKLARIYSSSLSSAKLRVQVASRGRHLIEIEENAVL